ncbi:MAG: CHAT domain-containing protein [Bacteroidetes bacterium]|jgi:CHAT domain-containing protein|nr:CHAT domain-containing protein [Bacteroidota bacterium]
MNRKITSFLIIVLTTLLSSYNFAQESNHQNFTHKTDSILIGLTWHIENEHLDSVLRILDTHGQLIDAVSDEYHRALKSYIRHDYQQVISQTELMNKHPARLYLALLKARSYAILDDEIASDEILIRIKDQALNHSSELLRLIFIANLVNPGNHEKTWIDTSIIQEIHALKFSNTIHELYKNFCAGMYYHNFMVPDSALHYYYKARNGISAYPAYYYFRHQLNQKMGDSYYWNFDASNSVYHFQVSLKTLLQQLPYLKYDLFYNYESLAFILRKDDFETASEYQQKALNLISDEPEYKIQALKNMTQIYYHHQKHKEAEQVLMQVEDLADQLYKGSHPNYIDIYQRFFRHYYFEHDNIFKALSYLELLIEAYEKYPERIDNYYYYCKGILHFETGTYRQALEIFREGLANEMNEKEYKSPYDVPDVLIPNRDMYLYQTRYTEYLAYTFYLYYQQETKDLKDLKASYAYYNLLANYYMNLREKKPEFQIRLMIDRLAERRIILDNIEVALEIYEKTQNYKYLEDFFEYMEKSRDLVLTNTIYARELKKSKNVPDSLLQKEKEIIMKLELIRSDLTIRHSDLKIETDKDQFERLVQEHENIKKSINKYFADSKPKKKMISIKQVQTQLKKNQVVLEYALKKSELFGIAITADTILYHRQKNPSTLIDDINKYNQILKEPPLYSTGNGFNEFQTISHTLYINLINPFNSVLKEKKELILIPEDILNTIAFETLIKQKNSSNTMDYASLPYLIKEYNISYGLSATLYFGQQPKLYPKPIYAVAPKYPFQSGSEQISRSVKKKLASLPALKGAQQEVEFLEKEFNAQTSIQSSLNESEFKSKVKSASILHLAMHSIIDPNYPEYSALILSSNTSDQSDGLLHTYEIMHYDLNNQLVVLSACNTGSGKLLRGEGVFSIAKGFIMSGCSGVITTLWEQNDAAGFDLMKNLYVNLFNTNSPSLALRNAKLNYLKHADPLKNHPYYWSGYILIGNPTIVHIQRYMIPLALMFTVALIYLGYMGVKRINRRNNAG